MIKVLIADDSTFIRKTIRQMLSLDPEIEIIDEAGDGREAIEKTIALRPDVITMDIIMPGVDGVWALEEIMKQKPTPIVIVSSIGLSSSDIIKEAFACGVVDIVTKPDSPQSIPAISKELIEKVKAASRISKLRLIENQAIAAAKRKPSPDLKATQLLVVVTSAGGPPSLYEVISKLSDKFSASIIVAQHMPSNFIESFVSHVQKMTPMPTRVAQKGNLLYSRRILFSPTNATVDVHKTKKGAVVDIVDYKTRLQPDIDKVIISCANVYKSNMVLVILSGLGTDGTKGAEVVKKYGGKVIVEDEATAGIYMGMPLSAVKSGYYDITCPSYGIAEAVENYMANRPEKIKISKSLLKGITIRSLVNYVRSKYPPETYDEVLSNISQESRNILSAAVNMYNYYSYELYFELLSSIYKVCRKDNEKIIEDVASAMIQECYLMYKQGFPMANIESFIKFIPTFQNVVFPGSSMEIITSEILHKRADLIDRNAFYNDKNIDVFTKTYSGGMKHLFTLSGFVLSSIKTESGQDSKGWFIKTTVRWN